MVVAFFPILSGAMTGLKAVDPDLARLSGIDTRLTTALTWIPAALLLALRAVQLHEPGLRRRPEPRPGDDRVGNQGRFRNIVGGVTIPPCGVPLRVVP